VNTNNFQYSVLKYKHSLLLNEVVNVGILFYFPVDYRIEFIYPTKLNRIGHLYPDFNTGTIKIVQSVFETKCRNFNYEWEAFERSLFAGTDVKKEFRQIITDEFLIDDASSLYFDDIKIGVNIGIEQIISYYRKEYFACYDDKPINPNKKDEKYIEHKFKQQLKSTSVNSNFNLEINKEISVGLFSEKFKWGWKNGTDNLIAPVGFDLLEPDTIKQKALLWFGKLSFLNDFAVQNNISFHLITSKPTDKNLFKAYDNALKVIIKAKAPKQLFEETNIDKYTDYLSKNITGTIK
jgi:hypothetical protein